MKPSADNTGHIPSLDGLRAVSIIIVFVAHSMHSLPIPGGFGVTIFFFISGYLITSLLVKEYGQTGKVDFRAFYIRRLFRLAPPLLITMAIGVILVLANLTEGTLNTIGLISQIFFFFNYWDAYVSQGDVISGTKIFWSLSVEEHFYFVYPFVLLLALRQKWPILWVIVLSIIVLVWRFIKFTIFGANEWEIYALTDTRFDSMLWGCLLAILMNQKSELLQKISRNQWRSLAVGGILLIVLTFLIRDEIFRSTLRYTVQGVALFPIFYFLINFRSGISYRLMNGWIIKKIGIYSYTFYLSHYIIIGVLNYNFPLNSEIAIALIAAILSFGYSAAMYHFVEMPIRVWRGKLLSKMDAGK
ncbi:acyltransferase [Novosphingobium sp. CECT 9465]|uniref:acyltransferase family protein n=1 Tax=Novosphingobium sp. CECT 9465 TaxID=2829794 RepID=UPI001E375E81|nr:acyltransferase [Novosphingobium sp. CECT 9465]CAH0497929.1 O-acetyltransferase OatA [Novosphingobium sp. CECT 9465]